VVLMALIRGDRRQYQLLSQSIDGYVAEDDPMRANASLKRSWTEKKRPGFGPGGRAHPVHKVRTLQLPLEKLRRTARRMDTSQYKDYVLVLLFVKYASDRYAGQKDALIEVPKVGSFADMMALKGDKEVGDKINKNIAVGREVWPKIHAPGRVWA
jgi:hypothetical protein